MKLSRKWLVVAALVISVAMATTGTLAYLTDTDSDVNVMTLGNVDIEQHEQQRTADKTGLETYTDGPLYPAYLVNGIFEGKYQTTVEDRDDNYKFFNEEYIVGAKDKIVTVENVGASDAYVRTWFAFEAPMDKVHILRNDYSNQAAGHQGNDDWTWEWIGGADRKHTVNIGGTNYVVAVATSVKALQPGETTVPSLLQVALDASANNADMEAFGGTYEILAFTQAVQTVNMPDDPAKALAAAFGEVKEENHPWVEGAVMVRVSNQAELNSAIQDGAVILLDKGEYTIPSSVAGKTVTFMGAGSDVVIDCTKAQGLHGAEIHFENLTIQGIDENYIGLQHTKKVTYTNCVINKSMNLYADDVIFTDCTFNLETRYIWTYGADNVIFDNCVFDNQDSRAILVYQENNAETCYVTVMNCTFKAAKKGYTGSGDWTAAVEIDTSLAPAEVTILNSTADANYSGLYRIKNGSCDVTVDSAVRAETNAELKDAVANNDNVTVVLNNGKYEANFAIDGGKNITIVGSGTNTVLSGQIASTSSTAGTLTLKNLTVKVDSSIQDSTGISQTGKSAIAIWGNQNVVCENVTFDMSLADATAITSWWDTDVGTSITVRDCTFNCNGQRPIRATGNVTVENCTFNDPYRYAVQLTAKTSTATLMDKAIINFKNNTIVNGENGKPFVYGIQLEGSEYGCHDCVINGAGNTIENGGTDSAMYYCECGKVDHATITWNTEVAAVHKN